MDSIGVSSLDETTARNLMIKLKFRGTHLQDIYAAPLSSSLPSPATSNLDVAIFNPGDAKGIESSIRRHSRHKIVSVSGELINGQWCSFNVLGDDSSFKWQKAEVPRRSLLASQQGVSDALSDKEMNSADPLRGEDGLECRQRRRSSLCQNEGEGRESATLDESEATATSSITASNMSIYQSSNNLDDTQISTNGSSPDTFINNIFDPNTIMTAQTSPISATPDNKANDPCIVQC
ncbi:hypothetical protein SeLEV6574_g00971 [Synchytrium endobioticum]|uniref:Uncharacterized protein n=1 Tax=Synchytrium endobioticum TaxID=286115 RepID=A0A507DG00_9FUNG|nr:hypothetical protein SeLEV6574_g02768 [Synchytrium endobioticum]TPX50321.1 hypothetical protein SeLEV6574_g00971 [Synchytrium endobioticum]